MSYDAARTVGELYWSSHEQTLSVTPGLFLSAILSSPKVAYSTFCSTRDKITLKYCWCPAARDAGGGGVLRGCVCVWACVHMCNSCNEEQQDRWHQLLCSAFFLLLTHLCFLRAFPVLVLSLSTEWGFCSCHTWKLGCIFLLKDLDEWYHSRCDLLK